MKNNCDVSGQHGDRAECKGEYESDGCDHWGPRQTSDKCYHYNCGYCHSLTAIRAAIEAEREDEPHWVKKKHSDCKYYLINHQQEPCASCFERELWEPDDHIVDANKKGGGRMKRYDIRMYGSGEWKAVPDAAGNWVDYDDAEATLSKLRRCGNCRK